MRAVAAVAVAVALTACGSEDATAQLGFDSGAAPAVPGYSPMESLLAYVIAPLAIIGLVALLVWLPGMIRGGSYRPGRAWPAPPLWFGGPPEPTAAVESADPKTMQRGGASGSW